MTTTNTPLFSSDKFWIFITLALICIWYPLAANEAAVRSSVSIPGDATILTANLEVWNSHRNETISEFHWGTLYRGDTVYSLEVWVKNTGDADAFLSWTKQSLPNGFTVTAWLYIVSNDSWVEWQENVIFPGPSSKDPPIAPGEFFPFRIRWKLYASLSVESGPFSFNLKIEGHDSQTG